MGTFNGSQVDLYNEGVKSLQECILEKTFALPSIADVMTTEDGIVHNKQIVFLSLLQGMVGKKVDLAGESCAPTANDCKIVGTQKLWTPTLIEDRIAECYKTLEQEFVKYMLNKGVRKPDITDTDWGMFITERYAYAIQEMILRAAWFADTDIAAYNASPAGTFYNGGITCVTTANFDYFDGIFKQIFAILAANPAQKTTDLSTKNAQATFALQAFNSTDTTNRLVTNALFNVTTNADTRIAAQPDKILLVTKSVADQYKRELRADSVNFTHETIMNGLSRLTSDGQELLVVDFWDRMIQNYSRQAGNVNAWYLPHRIVYTTKGNLALGTESLGSFTELDVFYDKVDKLNYFDFQMKIDAKLLENYLLQAAY
jgi:hypothetical protein